MKILALEFSSAEKSIAVLEGDVVLGFTIDRTPKGVHAFEAISAVLAEARMQPWDVECIAVGLGPGSYGGIRTSIAMAQGWHLARGVKLIGVSSAEAIARNMQSPVGAELLRRETPFHGVVNIVFDAQRQESYAIRYQISGAEPQALSGFELMTVVQETWRRDAGEVFIKADGGVWRLGQEPVLLAEAGAVGVIAAARSDFTPGYDLEPVYLRPAEFLKAPAPRFSAT